MLAFFRLSKSSNIFNWRNRSGFKSSNTQIRSAKFKKAVKNLAFFRLSKSSNIFNWRNKSGFKSSNAQISSAKFKKAVKNLAFFRLNKIMMYLIGAIKAGSNPLMPKSAAPNLRKPLRI